MRARRTKASGTPRWTRGWATSLGLVLALAGCTAELAGIASDDGTRTSRAPIVGGEATFEEPAAGHLSVGCTGTLVRPDVVLTAAHCFDYATRLTPGHYATFRIDISEGESYAFPVDRVRSLAETLGGSDLALAHLAEPVPASVVAPLDLATGAPPPAAAVTQYGYGCTDRSDFSVGGGIKRKYEYRYSTSVLAPRASCPGDSGGPTVHRGRVFRVTSYIVDIGPDGHGWVPRHHDALTRYVSDWESDPGETPACETLTAVEACDASFGCAFYRCADACLPAGTDLEEACPTDPVDPERGEPACSEHRTLEACNDAGPDCAWYACGNACHPRGTSLGVACPPSAATCEAIGDLPSCNVRGCAWYSCAEECHLPGTPLADVCGTESGAAEPAEPEPESACGGLPASEHGEPCSASEDGVWRCACSSFWGDISQVCREGIWQNATTSPVDCTRCNATDQSGCLH